MSEKSGRDKREKDKSGRGEKELGRVRREREKAMCSYSRNNNRHRICILYCAFGRLQVSAVSLGTTLFYLSARDDDMGRNGDVSYRILPGDKANLFAVTAETG